MASTVFYNGLSAEWLNDVNNHVYGPSCNTSNNDPITQVKTDNGFFQYDQYTVVKINRFNDRVFIGDATSNDAAPTIIGQDWLTEYQRVTGRTGGFIEFSQAAILTTGNPASCNGLTVGGQTSNLQGVGNSVPIIAVGINNNTTYATGTFAFYGEAYNDEGALGPAFGMELDTVNYQGSAPITPYAQHNKEVIALQLAAGAELPSAGQYPSSAAINIWNNNSTFDKGIVFGDTALSSEVALAFASGHSLQWYGPGGVPTSKIQGTGTVSSSAPCLNFTNEGLRVTLPGGQQIANFSTWYTDPANYIQFVPGPAGNPVQINAQGADANINLFLSGKGGGKVQFGTYTSGAPSPTGYITILDSNGVPRKLLVG